MWHFAAACLLLASFPVSLLHGLVSRRFWRHWLPITPGAVARDAVAAVKFRLRHQRGHYNAVQRLLYILVAVALLAMLVSGLAIWKPVQLWWLTALFGGFQSARLVHFLGMAGIVLFVAVHVLMALMVPRTIQAMITGHASPTSERIVP
jgi:thiosulfate reductase cytochrome b subunit